MAMMHAAPEDPIRQNLQQTVSTCVRAASLASQLLTFAKGGAPVRRTGSIAALLKDAVLHDEEIGKRSRPGHCLLDCRQAPRTHRRRIRGGRGDHILHLPARV